MVVAGRVLSQVIALDVRVGIDRRVAPGEADAGAAQGEVSPFGEPVDVRRTSTGPAGVASSALSRGPADEQEREVGVRGEAVVGVEVGGAATGVGQNPKAVMATTG